MKQTKPKPAESIKSFDRDVLSNIVPRRATPGASHHNLVTLMERQQESKQDLHQRISWQRVQHIVDSYLLEDSEAESFRAYLHELLSQYPQGLVELALVEILIKNWLTIPMQKGIPFLSAAHEQIKQWQQDLESISLTHSRFYQITGLDPEVAFGSLEETQPQPAPTATESTTGA